MMSDETEVGDQERRKPLSLKRPGRLELKKTVDAGQVRQSFSHGRSRAVAVEVRKKRTLKRGTAADGVAAPQAKAPAPKQPPPEPVAEAARRRLRRRCSRPPRRHAPASSCAR